VYTALVFSTDSFINDSVPSYLSYKIRMDMDRVDTTDKFKVTDRFVQLIRY